jgi:protein SSD1
VASQSQPHAGGHSAGAGRGRGSSHGRSQSLAVGNGRGNMRGGFNSNDQDFRRGGGGHNRTGSRNFDQNWRQPQTSNQDQPQAMGNFSANAPTFQPGHRSQRSVNQQSISSIGNFQYQGQPQLLGIPQAQLLGLQQLGMFGQQGLNALQLAQLQALQQITNPGMGGMQGNQQQGQMMGGGSQRKTLFTPYLPQSSLPELLDAGKLVSGILRVNKKNRSDAYVTTTDLDADIFICGSKDRNRALEGDLVAVELLDVDEVWGQKREKEEKKKRKDGNDGRSSIAVNDATTQPETAAEGGIRRRGSLRQRPTQKKNDDVEVEGQSLLLMEEEEINDEQKPLYAGHVVAVIERVAGQTFSGTLGLLRPSSQATKEKQEAERAAREGSNHRPQPERQQDRPKIVWFKPTDKRVPLIAIPTEQAPRDFVERHQDYANRIFVASIKRWPITSLHPFGTLSEALGEMGDIEAETDALLRDNNWGSDEFSDGVNRQFAADTWVVAEGEAALIDRRDFREEKVLTIAPPGVKELDNALHFKDLGDGYAEIGYHVSDIAALLKYNSVIDREARKRCCAVFLTNRTVTMLPVQLTSDLLALIPGKERYAVSLVFKVEIASGRVLENDTWVGKGLVKSTGSVSFDDIDKIVQGQASSLSADQLADVKALNQIVQKWREARFGDRSENLPSLRLMYQLDDENVPPEANIFNSSAAHELVEELAIKANFTVAKTIHAGMPGKALLRRQAPPNPRRLQTFNERMTSIGLDIDTESSGTLQTSVFKIKNEESRRGVETLLIKTMQRAKYFVAGKLDDHAYQHYALNLPMYAHFTHPLRRYTDIIVHRQLEAVLSGKVAEYPEDEESLAKQAEASNTRTDSAHFAQEQSVHIDACRAMDKISREIGGDLIAEGIVICVYESAFDVLIPEWGFEKRVHCDQLPLKKAEFDKHQRLLELYWEKGVPSSAYIPEDEQPKNGNSRGAGALAAAREAEAVKQREREQAEAKRGHVDTGTMGTDEVDALFEEDDDLAEHMGGVSLSSVDRPTQSMPPSPTKNGPVSGKAPRRIGSDSKLSQAAGDLPETKLSNKEKYLAMFTLREEGGEFIQDVRELTRVPVILKTDLSKSPP